MRDAVNLDQHSLGNGGAFMWHDPAEDKWSLTEVANWTKHDCRVREGGTQTATFEPNAEGITPPHFMTSKLVQIILTNKNNGGGSCWYNI
jgi:hypothetical protein